MPRFRLQPRNFYWAIVDTHANDATIFMLPTSRMGSGKPLLRLAQQVCDHLNALDVGTLDPQDPQKAA